MFDFLVKGVRSIWGGKNDVVVKTPRVYTKEEHGIDGSLVSFEARRTCELLRERGFRAYIVGGAVRDLMLGVKPKDFDVATDATPEQVKRSQRHAVIIGRRFRLVHVIFGREVIECSTFRSISSAGVRKDATGRVISDNVFGEMWEDAARRDFTINALYYDPATEEVLDYHDGVEDIRRKRLRMIGDPEARYREDPVRMIRAVRISAKLGFTIEPSTEKPIRTMARLLQNVPSARLNDELLKVLTCGHAVECLERIRAEHLERAIQPMLANVLDNPETERFFMLAMERTDERLASGKKTSPFFLYATLLWPQVRKRWVHRTNSGEKSLIALREAASEVLEEETLRIAAPKRLQFDMYDVWVMQSRFERRTGKHPFAFVSHPRYRAAFDFLILRTQAGEEDPSLVSWWERFAEADEDTRHEMVDSAQVEARRVTPRAAEEGAPEKKRRRRPHRSRRRMDKPAPENAS